METLSMSRRSNVFLTGMLACVVTLSATACRRADPPDAYSRNLGTEDAPLLPTSSVFKQPGIAGGRVEWIIFREPDSDQTADGAAGSGTKVNEAEVEAEIRAMFADYNELLSDAEATIDDFLDFFLEGQRDLVRPLLESTPTLALTLQELRSALQAKKVDEADRIDAAIKTLESTVERKLIATAVTVENDSKVTVTLATGPFAPSFECVIVDDEWFVQIPDADALQAAKPALHQVLSTYQGWLDDLKSDRSSADEIMQKIETAADAAQPGGSQEIQEVESGD